MTRVWRWENRETGVGPYQSVSSSGCGVLHGILMAHGGVQHPHPQLDGWYLGRFPLGITKEGSWRFGCPSLVSLQVWFEDVPEDLLRVIGQVVRCYEVPEMSVLVMDSGRQVAYDPAVAVLVSTQ